MDIKPLAPLPMLRLAATLRSNRYSLTNILLGSTFLIFGCTAQKTDDPHASHSSGAGDTLDSSNDDPRFPAAGVQSHARLQASPRHAEYVSVPTGRNESIEAFVVFPERKTGAPVVLVVHEIYGLTTWIKGVADQLAAEGFIAIAPNLVSLKKLKGNPDSVENQEVFREAVSSLAPGDVKRYLTATAQYGLQLPGASSRLGIVGFCWGGSASFNFANTSGLHAAVVYYGPSPDSPAFYDSVSTPILGLYAENDARVNTTIPFADSALKAQDKTFQIFTYEGAGHGFLRQQGGMEGANLNATKEAWPATIAWFRRYLEE